MDRTRLRIVRKLISRTLRNFVLRNKPFFAHYFVTRRCNLRCVYCNVPNNLVEEVDLESSKRIIDVIERMGVAVLSFTGGEPLLRKEVFELIEYAREKGLYTQITSNGTMSKKLYKRLIETGVDRISISLDDATKEALPYMKASKKILETMEYVAENRMSHQLLSTTIVLTEKNLDTIEETVDAVVERGFSPLVQPVVTGAGLFRTTKVKLPENVRKKMVELYMKKPILNPIEFINPNPKWKCKAGELFFDIQPNGDFWICQDIPYKLNVLEPDFMEKWKKAVPEMRRIRSRCPGCTYSCYYLTQRIFNGFLILDYAVTVAKNGIIKLLNKK